MKRYLTVGIATLVAVAGIAGWALRGEVAAADDGAKTVFTESERAAIGDVVRDYLLANPKLMREVMDALDAQEEVERQQKVVAAIAENGKELLQGPHDIVLGNPDGDVTMVEFFDYNCTYCKRSLADIAELIKTDAKLRVVLKEFPILAPGSIEAARVSMAAARQPDLIWQFHSELLESRGEANQAKAMRVAEDVGLDMDELAADLKDPEIDPTLKATQELADQIGIQGTPAFVVGNELVRGAIGLDGLREAVKRQRELL